MDLGTVTVFGGTGFLGRRIVARLLRSDVPVRVAARRPERVSLSTASDDPDAGYADGRDENSVRLAVAGAGAMVNAVGPYVERGAETFDAAHVRGALHVAR